MVRSHDPGTPAGPESFDDFYAANFQPVMLQLYAYTADLGLAQDAVQEAFTRAWARWDRLARYDRPAAWVRSVAMNVARNRWRRMRAARAHAPLHRDLVVDGPGPDRVALARAARRVPRRPGPVHRREGPAGRRGGPVGGDPPGGPRRPGR